MVTADGEIKLVDFGFAAELHGHGFLHGEVGTPGYMAPEIWNSQSGVSYQGTDADLFALGVTLFAAQFRSLPFQRARLDDAQYLALTGRGDPNAWGRYSQYCSQEFMNLIMNMI